LRPFILLLIEIIGALAVIQVFSISPAIKLKRPVKFTQPQREGMAALSIAVLIIVAVALLDQWNGINLLGFIPFAAITNSAQLSRPDGFDFQTFLIQTLFLLVMTLPFAWNFFTKKQPWLSVGLKKNMLKGGLQVGFGLVLISVFLRSKVDTLIVGPYTIQTLWLLLGSLTSCLVVEIIFRGYLQLRLMAWLGDLQGWLISAAIYTLWSILPLLHGSLELIAINIGYRLVMGLLLGWIARKSGGIVGGWLYSTIHNWLFWF
jgi:membrane protease YdiL (CAAX protease family)